MSEFRLFLKENKIKKQNVMFPATKSLCDEQGTPLMWELRPLTTKENEEIRDSCMNEVQVPGKYGMYRPQLDSSLYIAKMIAAAVVSPGLYSKELQDSYGVMTPEELIVEMIDNPGEYSNLSKKVQEISGFDVDFEENIEKAKN